MEADTLASLRRQHDLLLTAWCNSSGVVQSAVGDVLKEKVKTLIDHLTGNRELLDKDRKQAKDDEKTALDIDIRTITEEIKYLSEIDAKKACASYDYPKPAGTDEKTEPRSLSIDAAKKNMDDRAAFDDDARMKSSSYMQERLRQARALYFGLLRDCIDGLKLARGEHTVSPGTDVLQEINRTIQSWGQKLSGQASPPEGAAQAAGPRIRVTDFYPARYIRIFENNYKEKILLYDPRRDPRGQTTQLTAGADSELIIEVDPSLMGEEIALNRLMMTGKLLHGSATGQNSKQQDIEVTGYSEIAKDPQATASQHAVAFRSAQTIQSTILNMYYTTEDIIKFVYGDACASQLETNPRATCRVRAGIEQAVVDRFRLYKPEITAIAAFFNNTANSNLADILGAEIFGIEPASLRAIATQYKTDLDTLLASAITDKSNATARTDLLERTKLIWYDFHFLRDEIKNLERALEQDPIPCPQARQVFIALGKVPFETAQACWLDSEWKQRVRNKLKQKLVPGTISLGQYDAQDGDVITLRIEAREAGGTTIGNPSIFKIALKYYDWKFRVSPSLLFIHRQNTTHLDAEHLPAGVTAASINVGAKPLNFAPAPGVTAAFTIHKRGTTRGSDGYNRVHKTGFSSLMSFLTPGLGMNVSFLSFDQQDFDPATGKFLRTQSSGVQLGAGVVGSMFGNLLQFTYGWNLNSSAPRSYVGVGFGFVEVGKAIASVVKSTSGGQ